MPVWNTGLFLRESVESALSELEGVDGELICVDDNSDDHETQRVLRECSALSPRVRTLTNKSGIKGAGAARNYGVKHATGEWLLFLDSDDLLIEGSLRARLELIEQHPELEWISADFVKWYAPLPPEEKGYFAGKISSYPSIEKELKTGAVIVKRSPVSDLFNDAMPAHTLVVMVSRSLFERVGGFSTHLQKQEDTFLWLNLAHSQALFAFYPFPVGKYRIRQESLTHEDKASGVWRAQLYQSFYRNPDFKEHRKTLQGKISKAFLSDCSFYINKARGVKALRHAALALYWQPTNWLAWKSAAASFVALAKREAQ